MDRKMDLKSFRHTLARASMEQSPYAKLSVEDITARAVENLKEAMDQVRREQTQTDQ
ncbi:MAG: hypothetical protein ACU0GG_16250 [Paracoccaceae bacterium]